MTVAHGAAAPELAGEVRFVSFTVDPQNDTPERLAAYALAHAAGPGLDLRHRRPARRSTGSPREGFKLAALEVPPGEQKDGGDGPFLHSSKFVLVDGAGRDPRLLRQHGRRGGAGRPGARRAGTAGRRLVTVRDLPTLNAVLNATAAALLLLGYVAHQAGPPGSPPARHAGRPGLLGAVPGLLPHLPLPGGLGPLPGAGPHPDRLLRDPAQPHRPGRRHRAPGARHLRARPRSASTEHRRIARITLPLWGYVSVTGVVVYWMLYRL